MSGEDLNTCDLTKLQFEYINMKSIYEERMSEYYTNKVNLLRKKKEYKAICDKIEFVKYHDYHYFLSEIDSGAPKEDFKIDINYDFTVYVSRLLDGEDTNIIIDNESLLEPDVDSDEPNDAVKHVKFELGLWNMADDIIINFFKKLLM
jgi:hypothetical protein